MQYTGLAVGIMAVVVVAVGGASTSTAREATKPLAVQLILDELGGLNPRLESVIERLQSGRKPWEEEPELESLSMLLDDIVMVLIPLVYGIPFEEWFSCFYKVDWWIDHITEFIMPEQGDDPTVVLKEAAWDLGNASDRIAGFDERFLAPATTTKNDEGLNAVREKLLALRKWIDDLRDRINKGYVSVSDMLTEVWGFGHPSSSSSGTSPRCWVCRSRSGTGSSTSSATGCGRSTIGGLV